MDRQKVLNNYYYRQDNRFGALQAKADLTAMIAHLCVANASAFWVPRIKRIMEVRVWQFAEVETKADYDFLSRLAVEPDRDFAGFLCSTGVLLLGSFAFQNYNEDIEWYWESFTPEYRKAPQEIRAAICNGFWWLRHTGCAGEKVAPLLRDRLTRERSALIAALIPLAKAMTDAEREHISFADYGYHPAQHRAALDEVLAGETCLFLEGEGGYSVEVVELVAHGAKGPGFLPATALLLINCLDSGDADCHMSFRWDNMHKSYLELVEPHRTAILNGIRYFYEANKFWEPEGTCAIPWVR